MDTIRSFKIQRYRAFRDFSVGRLGRVNLITGKNNTGKSSLLEALHLFLSKCSESVMADISGRREEAGVGSDRKRESPDVSSLENFFHGFPRASEGDARLTFSDSNTTISMIIGRLVETMNDDGTLTQRLHLVPLDASEDSELNGELALAIQTPTGTRFRQLDSFLRRRSPMLAERDSDGSVCQYVGAYGGESTKALGRLWDTIGLSDWANHVVDAVRLIDSDIERVSMVERSTMRGRIAQVRKKGIDRPIALRSLGDGVNRLFGIILKMVNAADGVLLIDEFENGLHYTVQYEAWRIIFKLARDLNIQVFATSHSWDAIEAFQKVACESDEDGVLVRLTRKGGDVLATTFSEDELAIATRSRIEVR